MAPSPTAVQAVDTHGSDRCDIDRYRLRFSRPAEERRYRAARGPSDLRYARAVIAFVLALTLAVVPLDLRLFDPGAWSSLVLGHSLELTVVAALMGLTFVPYFQTRLMALMSVLAVFFTAIYAAWNALLGSPDVYVAGGVLVIVAIYVLLPLDFVRGAATAVGCSALYLAVVGSAGLTAGTSFLILAFLMVAANAIGAVSLYHIERLRRLDFANLRKIEAQRAGYRDLLVRILPQSIAERLQRGERDLADRFEDSTVLFADLVGFTGLAARHAPEEVVAFLERVFAAFDELVRAHDVEKIKTIGDAYMVAGGLPFRRPGHAAAVADLALAMLDTAATVARLDGVQVQLRIGISTGPLVAGVIGRTRFSYDLWGDTVNVASRMEAYGEPGRIQVSEAAYRHLAGGYLFEPRGEVEVKGLGRVPTWYLLGRKPPAEA